MQVLEVSAQLKQQYQAFVQSKGIFLQDWEWGDFQESLGRKVFRFAFFDNGAVIGAVQLLQQHALGFDYLFAPYGPVLQDPDLLRFFLKELAVQSPKILFLRVEPHFAAASENFNPGAVNLLQSYNLNPHKTLFLDLSKNEQQLLAEMHPKTRYNIKVAQRDGVEIKMHSSAQNLLAPIFETGKRAGIRSFPESYYLRLVEHFSSPESGIKAKVFTAWHGDELLATNIVLFYQQTCTYLFGGSVSHKRNLMAPYLLQWQTIQKAKEEGYKNYDFWGVEDDKNHAWAGISRFKFGFGGAMKKYSGTFDYPLKPAWYNIYSVLRTLNRLMR